MRRITLLPILAILLAGCSGSDAPENDADADGLRDDLETTPRTITIQSAEGPTSRNVRSDPNDSDSDDDGLGDLDEFVRKTDPQSMDTDEDGLLDGHDVEVAAGGSDAARLRALGIYEDPPGRFWGEMDRCPANGGTRAAEWSSDRPLPDGLGDVEEMLGWNVTLRGETRAVTSDPCVADTDRDGLPDDREKARGTDPRAPDTDGDGTRDSADADPLWNLTLRLDQVTARRADGGDVRLTLGAGPVERSLIVGENDTIDLDVPDDGAYDSLVVQLVVAATDPVTGEPVRVFADPRGGTILTLDLFDEGETLTFEGEDGSLSFRWSAARV